MENNKNKLQKFDPDALPTFFKDLTKEQQTKYLETLATDNAELKKLANEKMIVSRIAERDMVTDLEYMKQIETENKVVNIKREYNTGSGKLEVNIKGGDKKFLIPVLIVSGLIIVAIILTLS